MENQPSNGKKAMEQELIRGRDLANQLLEVLVDRSNIHLGDNERSTLPFAEDLVRKVLRSFTNTLLLLSTNHNCGEVVVPVTIGDFSLSTNCPKPEAEGIDEACKSINNTSKNRRRCHKRKSSIAPTWERDSSILCADGHVWRKYGQKKTMNSKYLRSYYRCTYKNEQGCQAMKQVQRIQDDPPLYRTTYYGHHTCKSSLSPNTKLEPASSFESSTLLCFSNNNSLPSKQARPFSPSISSSTKQEPMEVIPDDYIVHNQSSSSNDLLCDYELFFNY